VNDDSTPELDLLNGFDRALIGACLGLGAFVALGFLTIIARAI